MPASSARSLLAPDEDTTVPRKEPITPAPAAAKAAITGDFVGTAEGVSPIFLALDFCAAKMA